VVIKSRPGGDKEVHHLCVEAKQVAVAEHPSDGESLKTSKTSLERLVSLVVRKGYLDFRLPPYIP
jgi:hypothetical protein